MARIGITLSPNLTVPLRIISRQGKPLELVDTTPELVIEIGEVLRGPPGPPGTGGGAGPSGPLRAASVLANGSEEDTNVQAEIDRLTRVVGDVARLNTANPFTRIQYVVPFETTVQALGNSILETIQNGGGTNAPASAGHSVFDVLVDGDVLIAAPLYPENGMPFTYVLTQDSVGGHVVSLGSQFAFAGSAAPVFSTAPGAVDVLECYFSARSGKFLSTLRKAFA